MRFHVRAAAGGVLAIERASDAAPGADARLVAGGVAATAMLIRTAGIARSSRLVVSVLASRLANGAGDCGGVPVCASAVADLFRRATQPTARGARGARRNDRLLSYSQLLAMARPGDPSVAGDAGDWLARVGSQRRGV